jgi:hypothetical protein
MAIDHATRIWYTWLVVIAVYAIWLISYVTRDNSGPILHTDGIVRSLYVVPGMDLTTHIAVNGIDVPIENRMPDYLNAEIDSAELGRVKVSVQEDQVEVGQRV